MLEAEAACGSLIDPLTGDVMSISDGIKRGLADEKYKDALTRAATAVFGYDDPVTHKTLSLYEAMKKNYVVESHGIR